MPSSTHRPTDIVLHQGSRILEIAFDSGERFRLPCEYLRVFSPSAEVRGHGPGQEVLQVGKRDVNIETIEPVGAYAVKLVFSDGHDTGLYSWDCLYELGRDQERNWKRYLDRLKAAGASRDPAGAVNLHKFKRAEAPEPAPRFREPPTDE
ncbi:MAG: DUF971 domain-containing protein [Betaproteobacteria bacterium]|nr:DUF971 domain-containing protein [Betaproteobacteria bacterium]